MTGTRQRFIEFKCKQKALSAFLDTDDILKITDEELILLEQMNGCLAAYVEILAKKWKIEKQAREDIIKLSDKSHIT
jgi:hypothetical protein